MRSLIRFIVAFAAITALVACCSCGGSSPALSIQPQASPSSAGEAQGVYSGTTSTGSSFVAIILPDDALVALYGTQTSNVFYIAGILFGGGKSDHGNFTVSWIDDYYYTGTITNGSLSATYVVDSTFNGSFTETGAPTINFTAEAMTPSLFNYDTPASLSDITGTWTGTLLDATSASVTINPDGTFTGSSSGCSFSGTVTPDKSNKNFFNFQMIFGGSPCSDPNEEAAGIAVDYVLAGTTIRQLVMGGRTTSYYGGPAQVFVATR